MNLSDRENVNFATDLNDIVLKSDEVDVSAVLKKFSSKIKLEAFIKALSVGLIIGCGANIMYAFFDWMFGLKTFYLGLIILGAVGAGATALLYFLKFRPTDKTIARRLDILGLEERIITMNELKGDDSYMAMRQRADAMVAINGVSPELIKILVSVPLTIAVAATFGLSAGSSVAAATIKKSGVELIEEIVDPTDPEQFIFDVEYDVDGEGYIEGDVLQRIDKGENGTLVTAVAEEGWIFVGWSDNYEEPTRFEENVEENLIFYAIFQEAEESEEASEGEGEGEGEDGDPGDPSEGEGEGQSQQEQEEGEGSENAGNSSGRSAAENQIIDGQTYYGDEYKNAVSDAYKDINDGGSYSDDMAELINDYLKGLGGSEGGENP